MARSVAGDGREGQLNREIHIAVHRDLSAHEGVLGRQGSLLECGIGRGGETQGAAGRLGVMDADAQPSLKRHGRSICQFKTSASVEFAQLPKPIGGQLHFFALPRQSSKKAENGIARFALKGLKRL